MNKIIFATSNAGKMKEIREILKDLNVEILSMKEAGIDVDIVEDGKTFEENALIKARAIRDLTGCLVLADDSGLEVDALNKEPGIYSARYMGEDTSYNLKNANIIERLSGLSGEERSARFVCAIAAVFPDGAEETCQGTIEGQIAYAPAGENGFGYDPIFYVPEYDCTTAQLAPEQKNEISHRGKALKARKEVIRQRIVYPSGHTACQMLRMGTLRQASRDKV